MENLGKQIAVNQLEFSNQSEEVILKGQLINQNLSYQSTFIVGISMLNVLLNNLQKSNPDLDVQDLIEVESLPNGELNYLLNVEEISNILPAWIIESAKTYKQIRA
jgi:glycyl-tRNA synthetase alpha subunit